MKGLGEANALGSSKHGAYVKLELPEGDQAGTSDHRHEGQVHQGVEGLLQKYGAGSHGKTREKREIQCQGN